MLCFRAHIQAYYWITESRGKRGGQRRAGISADKLFLRIAPQCEGEVAPFVLEQNDWVSVELTERSGRVRQESCVTLSMRRDRLSGARLCSRDRFEWWSEECSRVLLSVCWSSAGSMPGAWELLSEMGDIPALLIPAPAVSKNAQAEISCCLGSRIHFRNSPVVLRSFDMPFSSFVDLDCPDKKWNHFSILLNHSRSCGLEGTADVRGPCLNCAM